MKCMNKLSIVSLAVVLSRTGAVFLRKAISTKAFITEEEQEEKHADASTASMIGMNPIRGESEGISVKRDVDFIDYLAAADDSTATATRKLNVFDHSILPTWRDEVHVVWVNGPTHKKQLGGNWPDWGTVTGGGTGQCNPTSETFSGYNTGGAYCQKSNDYFDQNPHLVMYSGNIGLVLDASPDATGSVIRQMGGTGHLESSLVNAKDVYDNLGSGSVELYLDLTCTGSGPISGKATLVNGVAEFGMVRQGHAVAQVTVDNLVWSDAGNERIIWNTDPAAKCTLVPSVENPSNPNCFSSYTNGATNNHCNNPEP